MTLIDTLARKAPRHVALIMDGNGRWAQARGLPTPVYSEVERSGPAHLPRFVMQVALEGFEPERGEATSKRAAEQAAAQAFLLRWATP